MKLHVWKTVSGLFFTVALAAIGGGSTGAELGCSTTASGSSSGGSGSGSGSGVVRDPPTSGDIPSGCSADSTLTCDVDALGISCPSGTSPDDPTLICSDPSPSADGTTDGFCCLTWVTSGTTCSPDATVTGCDYPSYGFSCTGSDTPDTEDASLTCSADQGTGTFCCVDAYSNSSSGTTSGGGFVAATGCTEDDTLDCVGGAFGYACGAGDNPENEDPTLSCSVPSPNGSEDDFCCYVAPSGDFSAGTCAPDDGITSVCQYPSYGYICAAQGDVPSDYDSTLSACSTPVQDADGTSWDFCCSY